MELEGLREDNLNLYRFGEVYTVFIFYSRFADSSKSSYAQSSYGKKHKFITPEFGDRGGRVKR